MGTSTNGTPCRATPQNGSPFCFLHDPNKAEEQRRAHQAGGSTRAAKVRSAETPPKDINSFADVKGLLSDTIHQVRTGVLDPKVANCVGYLSGILLKAIEVGDIEGRLAAVEASVRHGSQVHLAGDFDRPLPGEDDEPNSDDKEVA
jgi:hypothetical protein